MRVIAGIARGTNLKTPRGLTVRPTADRVKEALFSMLGYRVIGSNFIDLFAGSGAVGIEALSRGARHCIFVENSRVNLTLIEKNLHKTNLTANAKLIMADARKAIGTIGKENYKADLIFIDPPYANPIVATVIDLLFENNILNKQGLLIIEHSCEHQDWIKNYPIDRQKIYGNTALTFISYHELPISSERNG